MNTVYGMDRTLVEQFLEKKFNTAPDRGIHPRLDLHPAFASDWRGRLIIFQLVRELDTKITIPMAREMLGEFFDDVYPDGRFRELTYPGNVHGFQKEFFKISFVPRTAVHREFGRGGSTRFMSYIHPLKEAARRLIARAISEKFGKGVLNHSSVLIRTDDRVNMIDRNNYVLLVFTPDGIVINPNLAMAKPIKRFNLTKKQDAAYQAMLTAKP